MTTIHDVARRAGVSPVTVSRVMNGASNVNAATRERVEQAIRELGYVPNLAARSLRSRQTSTLALIVPDVTNAFWTTVARGAEDVAQSAGYSVLLCNSDENPAKQQAYINAVLQQRVDGVMIAPYDADASNLRQLRELKTPTVIVDRRVRGWDLDTVLSDSVSGMYALVQHLISLGHRQIAMISGPRSTSTAEDRVVGYCLALDEAGIPIDPRLIRRGEYRSNSGRLLTYELLDEGLSPSAVVAANNVIAMGVIEALQARGKRVPQDVALVSFDELPDVARFFPFLTVVLQPAYDMGLNAAQLLISRIDADAPLSPRHVVLPNRLVLRYSCGRFLHQPGVEPVNLTLLKDPSETILVRQLPPSRLERIHRLDGVAVDWQPQNDSERALLRPDIRRLMQVFHFQPADRLPFLEPRLANKAVLEYVLERSLPYSQVELTSGRQSLSPEEAVDFAQRIGMDAIPFEVNWLPGPFTGERSTEAGVLRQIYPPTSLSELFNRLERYLRAVQGSQVGVYASFSGIVNPAKEILRADGDEFPAPRLDDARLGQLMDVLLAQQEMVMRALCDRFSNSLAFVLVRDCFGMCSWSELDLRVFQEQVCPRIERLIAPAKEHGLLVGISHPGCIDPVLPDLHAAGFGLVHPVDPDLNDLAAIRRQWGGRLVFAGGFPTRLLQSGSAEPIEAWVKNVRQEQARGGGLALGLSDGLSEGVLPGQFMALIRAVQQYGVYEASPQL